MNKSNPMMLKGNAEYQISDGFPSASRRGAIISQVKYPQHSHDNPNQCERRKRLPVRNNRGHYPTFFLILSLLVGRTCLLTECFKHKRKRRKISHGRQIKESLPTT